MSVYEKLAKLDVKEFIEKKGKFSYLSWADAVDVLLKHYPEAAWEVHTDMMGLPYVQSDAGAFVTVSLTIEGITRTQVHPVLNHQNKAVKDPDSFQINTSIQRCLAKAISLHGLGLYIYRGEDLPSNPEKVSKVDYSSQVMTVRGCIDEKLYEDLKTFLKSMDAKTKQGVWTSLSEAERLFITKEVL